MLGGQQVDGMLGGLQIEEMLSGQRIREYNKPKENLNNSQTHIGESNE
jgi:hypothetical protein